MTWSGNAAGIREDFYTRAAESALHAFHAVQAVNGASQEDVALRLEKFHQYIRSEQYERDLDQLARSNDIRYEKFPPLRYPYHHPQLEIRIAAKSWIVWELFRDRIHSVTPMGGPKTMLTLAIAFSGNKLGELTHFAYSAFSTDRNASQARRAQPLVAPTPITRKPALKAKSRSIKPKPAPRPRKAAGKPKTKAGSRRKKAA